MDRKIYDEIVEIDQNQVKQFWNERSRENNPLASVMLKKEQNTNIAEKRHQNEINLLTRLNCMKNTNVLDIGCGCGRIASHFQNIFVSYDGIDFTHKYIDHACSVYDGISNIAFYCQDVTELNSGNLKNNYNTVLIIALCIYLNDELVHKLFSQLPARMKSGSQIYLRESISVMGQRLTLSNFYSEELQSEYCAIYRTPEEYLNIIRQYFPQANIVETGQLLTNETGARVETSQQFWFIKV